MRVEWYVGGARPGIRINETGNLCLQTTFMPPNQDDGTDGLPQHPLPLTYIDEPPRSIADGCPEK